jgi:hypothetical protein
MNQLFFSLLLLVALSLTGCDNSTMHMNTTEKPQPQKNLERAYSGKPVAPIQLEHQILGDPQNGIPLTISLKITPAVAANRISINISTSPELYFVDGHSMPDFVNLAAGQTVTHIIEVVPQAESKHHLRVNVYVDSVSGRSGARSFSITFTTGKIAKETDLPNATSIQPAPNGEKLIIQKGAETRTTTP